MGFPSSNRKRKASPWGEAPAKRVMRGTVQGIFPSSVGYAATFSPRRRLSFVSPINFNLSKRFSILCWGDVIDCEEGAVEASDASEA